MMSNFEPGEVVDVAIKGVRVVYSPIKGEEAGFAILDEHGLTYRMPPQAAVARVAPAEWPPQPGDLWRDRSGALWFAALDVARDLMFLAADGRGEKFIRAVVEQEGPLTLVHREPVDAEIVDEQDGGRQS